MEWIGLIVLGVVSAGLYWMFFVEPYGYRLREREITLPFPGPKELTILHITDLHFIPKRRRLLAFLKSLHGVKADLVVHTGDFLDEPVDLALLCDGLAGIQGRRGTFAVFGNHDYYRYRSLDPLVHPFLERYNAKRFRDVRIVRSALEEIGVRILSNASCGIECDGFPIRIVGIDDPFMGCDDVETAFSDVDEKETVFVLSHSPEVYEEVTRRRAALLLCGHTHGGQIRVPLLGALVTRCPVPRSMARGFTRIADTTVFVSPGMGTSPNLMLRFFCPPEATLLRVRFEPVDHVGGQT